MNRSSKPDIVEVIERYIELKPKGSELVGLCPFHDDSKPSLMVNKQKQIASCFACSAVMGGDVYDFVQQYHGVGFKEAKRIAHEGTAGPNDAEPPKLVVDKVERQTKMKPEEAAEIASNEHARAVLEPPGAGSLAKSLGVSKCALLQLRVGKHAIGLWSFPMSNERGRVVGIRIRAQDNAAKWAITGSSEGLFIPKPWPYQASGPLLVCEGPTDTAAALSLGYLAFGRPSCKGAHQMCVDLINMTQAPEVWIISDPDIYGVEGAERLADEICEKHQTKLVIPGKGLDLRKWVKSGADRDWLERTARDFDYYRRAD